MFYFYLQWRRSRPSHWLWPKSTGFATLPLSLWIKIEACFHVFLCATGRRDVADLLQVHERSRGWRAASLWQGHLLLVRLQVPQTDRHGHNILSTIPVWIRNDLFRIRLRIFRVLDSDPTHVMKAYLKIIFEKHLLPVINQKEESFILAGSGTNNSESGSRKKFGIRLDPNTQHCLLQFTNTVCV